MSKELTVVTGASRGIGKGIALKFAKEGHNIIAFGRDIKALEETVSELKGLGADSEYYSGDAADENFVKESIKTIIDKYGKIDHLINNAGMGIFKFAIDAELADFKQQVEANLYSVFNFSKAVIPGMIKHEKGSIINIASLAGKNAFETGTMYSATKHAVLGFTKSLMLEVRKYNIRVAAVCPGSVNTDFGGERVRPNADKILQISDVADAVWSIISLPKNALMSEIDLRPTNPK